MNGPWSIERNCEGNLEFGGCDLTALAKTYGTPLYVMNEDIVRNNAKKYSKTYARNSGKWVDDFDAMAKKTVIKSLLSKWGVLSIEMQRAVAADQAVVKDLDGTELQYSDNDESAAAFEIPETVTAKRAGDGTAE